MQADLIKKIKQRSQGFLHLAKDCLARNEWDLACFQAEQAVQLYIKATILEKSGSLPRIHSIRQLLSVLSQITKVAIKFDRLAVIALEDAYFKTRYLDTVYEKSDAELAIKTAEELIALVG